MGPIPIDATVPSRGAVAVIILLLFLGAWKVLDIILWLEEHIYFNW